MEEQIYKKRLEEHAGEMGIDKYVSKSSKRYVILSNANEPEHWVNADETDETDWVTYESRKEAEKERQFLISQRDYGHRVVTERYFLKIKGLI